MVKKREMVVRMVMPDGVNKLTDEVRQLLEQLRAAHVIRVHRDNAEGVCFDLRCPPGHESKTWADMESERMRSFHYNAVAAPAADYVKVHEEPSAEPYKLAVRCFHSPALNQEFGWLPEQWTCEPVGLRFGQFLGRGRTKDEAIGDLRYRIKSEQNVDVQPVETPATRRAR